MKRWVLILAVALTGPAMARASDGAEVRCAEPGAWEARIAACTELLATRDSPRARARAYLYRGEAHLALGATLEAVRDLGDATRLAPSMPAPHLALGMAYLEAGRPSRALAALDIAAGLAPGLPEVWYWRAWAKDGLGRSGAALADLDRALAIDPGHPAARLARARLRCGLGDVEGAAEDTGTALASGAMSAERLAAHLAGAGFAPAAGRDPLSPEIIQGWARAGCP